MAPIPASSRISSSRRCSTSPATPASMTRCRPIRRGLGGSRSRGSGSRSIHIAERDTQVAEHRRSGRASSSTPGRSTASSARAASRPSWAGARTRTHFPADGRRHDFGCGAAIYLERPGAGTRVRTWTPLEGPFHGFLVTHNESISIADYYTVRNGTARRVPADGALCLPPLRRRGAVAARVRRQELAAAAGEAADDGRDHVAASTSSACC